MMQPVSKYKKIITTALFIASIAVLIIFFVNRIHDGVPLSQINADNMNADERNVNIFHLMLFKFL